MFTVLASSRGPKRSFVMMVEEWDEMPPIIEMVKKMMDRFHDEAGLREVAFWEQEIGDADFAMPADEKQQILWSAYGEDGNGDAMGVRIVIKKGFAIFRNNIIQLLDNENQPLWTVTG